MKKIAEKTIAKTETNANKKNIFLLTKDDIEMVHGGKGIPSGLVGAGNKGIPSGFTRGW